VLTVGFTVILSPVAFVDHLTVPVHSLAVKITSPPGQTANLLAEILGGALRYWSIKTLGHFFTASVLVTDSQKIITGGPYKILRHPSYTGGLLTVVGTPLVLENTYSVFLTLFLMILAYAFRIKAEEKAMIKTFGNFYRTYQQNTRKLIPLLW
jgi:protein-S-isoprenylcysteine O-methyltransferase Ste14